VSRLGVQQAPGVIQFKDAVFGQDEITTHERSVVRLLLGGTASVTVYEQSKVLLAAELVSDGRPHLILRLLAGKLAVAGARGLMRPGETIEVSTPTALATSRGGVVFAEHNPPFPGAASRLPLLLASSGPLPLVAQTPPPSGGMTHFLALSGDLTITPLGQPPLALDPLHAIRIAASPGGTQTDSAEAVTLAQASQLAQSVHPPRAHTLGVGPSGGAQALLAVALTQSLLEANGVHVQTVIPSAITALHPPITSVVSLVPEIKRIPPSRPSGPRGGSPCSGQGGFALHHSTMTVRNGPLMNGAGGTNMTVNGDFASLLNGARISVQNGPLISVGSPNLIISGAFVNFWGTGGNHVIINNAIPPTTSGVGLTMFRNIGSPGTTSVTGNPIQATGAGRVTLSAP
ncbi:MAG TPA: hypothetical protein VEU07_02400, partial [Candidatus Acidoferrum sp.]|nr:hypothetical protein [Candidatus Acidoferrum sp.]